MQLCFWNLFCLNELSEFERTAWQDQLRELQRTALQEQLCRSLDSLIRQLDLVTSLSLALVLGSKSCRTQLQNKPVQQLTQQELSAYKRSFAYSNFGCIQLGCLPAQELAASNAAALPWLDSRGRLIPIELCQELGAHLCTDQL